MEKKPIKQNPFNVHESLELKSAISRSVEEIKVGGKEFPSREEFEEIQRIHDAEKADHIKNYPPNPPNAMCSHSLLHGFFIDNSFGPRPQEINKLLQNQHETLFVWTGRENHYSLIISEVSEEVLSLPLWRNLGVVLKYVDALACSFESIQNTEYGWIYRFDDQKKWEEQEFMDELYNINGTVKRLEFFREQAPLIDLLISNDVFFYAVQNLIASVEDHSFCLICAQEKEEDRWHPNHEPYIWEYAQLMPKLENAIVNATKAVEGILGQQGSNADKALKRWNANLNLDPRSIFADTGKTYIRFHKYLIDDVRNKVAHNIRNQSFKASRQMAINAQLYAWDIIRDFYHKNRADESSAVKNICLNESLINREREDFSTRMTK